MRQRLQSTMRPSARFIHWNARWRTIGSLPLVFLANCQDATQVDLEVSTDAMCSDVRETSITVATAEELGSKPPDTTTDQCEDASHRIGTLAVVPSDRENSAFSVRVVTGLGKSAEQCVEDGYLGGCIVARRSLRFIPHRTLHLPIQMEVVCKDIPCSATMTCRHGRCVDDTIPNVDDCASAQGCDLPNGGTSGTGGATAGGAATANTGGRLATGGSTSGAGSPPTGGAYTTALGGAVNTGGAPNAGGSTSATVAVATGGVPTTVLVATGGSLPIGGTAASGGFGASGGMVETGGLFGTGGSTSASTMLGAGGIATGGSSVTGGNATGGIATGGSNATGGNATGGIATGGSNASGGNATGGIATGGSNATGGNATGGIATGGSSVTGGSSTSGGATGGNVSTGGSGVAGTTSVPSICGDGILDAFSGETCDTAGESPTCNANCTRARCGDGITNNAASEACDGSNASVHCTPSCKVSVCGDGYVDALTGEECESGLGGCINCKQDVSGQSGVLRVLAKRSELLPTSLNLDLQISNSGPSVSERGLTLRYYYTPDNSNTQSASCNFLDAGCSNTNFSVVPLKKTCSNATHYIQMVITANTNLGANSSLTIQGSVSGGLLNLYDFSNDYSRPEGLLLYREAPTVTLYQNGKLIWGTPPCGCGNGALDAGEQCDNGGESAYCNKDCTLARCGDGKINPSLGETCDAGQPSLTCDGECHSTGLPSSASSAIEQWIDASWTNGIVLSPHVYSVRDRSPAGNDLLQTDPTKQPYLFANAFGVLPALYFDGIHHELTAASSINNLGTGSVLIVHRVSPVGLTATLLGNGWSGSGGGFSIRTRPQLDGLGFAFGATSNYSTQLWTIGARTGGTSPNPRATYWGWNPPNFAWQSGSGGESLMDTGAYASTGNPLSYGGIAAQEPFTGWIAEVLVFNRALTNTERDAILVYLRAKWGVQ
jgi:hypothetical protein